MLAHLQKLRRELKMKERATCFGEKRRGIDEFPGQVVKSLFLYLLSNGRWRVLQFFSETFHSFHFKVQTLNSASNDVISYKVLMASSNQQNDRIYCIYLIRFHSEFEYSFIYSTFVLMQCNSPFMFTFRPQLNHTHEETSK